MKNAIFLDRDGVINELYYDDNQGVIDSPFHPDQFKLFPNVGKAINTFHKLGYLVIIISNQPGIAKQHFTEKTFESVKQKMKKELKKDNAYINGEYYCFHHPDAKIEKYRKKCNCRKPKPGMIKQAVKDHKIDISSSWMIGDSVIDIELGRKVGCKTIFIGNKKCYIWVEMKKEPDYVASSLYKASTMIKEHDGGKK